MRHFCRAARSSAAASAAESACTHPGRSPAPAPVLLTALSLSFSAEGFLRTAQILFLAHIPVMIVEGVITALAVSFIAKVRPEILQFSKE